VFVGCSSVAVTSTCLPNEAEPPNHSGAAGAMSSDGSEASADPGAAAMARGGLPDCNAGGVGQYGRTVDIADAVVLLGGFAQLPRRTSSRSRYGAADDEADSEDVGTLVDVDDADTC
jgi:hypothetical protein